MSEKPDDGDASDALLRQAAYVEDVPIEPAPALSGQCGPYEILGPIGAGGMGEVYRARDPRLGRDVAIKILPRELVDRSDRARRFEREARAAGSLKHDNVVAVYDVGRQGASPYVVFELLEGQTLRQRLDRGAPPLATAMDWAVQICRGLDAAHRGGIVHRDLKPENIHLGRDGVVKILDFGLAKVAEGDVQTQTEPGRILGTVGYMSPEQVRGVATDARSDLFSLGAVLFELLTGKRPFRAKSGVEVMHAILSADPLTDPVAREHIPPALRDVLERCLAKEPVRRPDSARELLTAIERAAPLALAAPGAPSRWGKAAWVAGALALAVAAWGGYAFARRPAPAPHVDTAPPVTFRRLTYTRGLVTHARFTSDAHTVVYSAAWEGRPVELFSMRPDATEARSLAVPGAILALSRSDEMALSLGRTKRLAYVRAGLLARAPFSGGAPRPVLADVQEADWSPSGELAVVRFIDGRSVLEYPLGTRRYESRAWLTDVRVSRDGEEVAVIDHPDPQDDAGDVVLVGRGGARVLSTGWHSIRGLAWSPGGEVWFTAARESMLRELRAVSRTGVERLVAREPGSMTLKDVAPDGRVLITVDDERGQAAGLAPGEHRERDLSWLDYTNPADLTPDGKLMLFYEAGTGGGGELGTYVRMTDGSAAVHIAEGFGSALSPDGQRALVLFQEAPRLRDVPLGAGVTASVDIGDLEPLQAAWLDSKRILVIGKRHGRGPHLFLRSHTGDLRDLTPELAVIPWSMAASPNGRTVVFLDEARHARQVAVDSGKIEPFPSLNVGESPTRWNAEGSALFAFTFTQIPANLVRVDLPSGKRSVVREVIPNDPVGVSGLGGLLVSSDGGAYVYNYVRMLSDLYIADGWK